MIAGLPLTAWLLLLVAVGLGLGIVLIFNRTHRRNGTSAAVDDNETG